MLCICFIIGILAGAYPAFFVASLNPANSLKTNINKYSSKFTIQKILVVSQYAISSILVIGSLIIYQQFNLASKKQLRSTHDQLLTTRILDRNIIKNISHLKNTWSNNPNIISATTSSELPINIQSSTIINDEDNIANEKSLNIQRVRVDYDFIETFGLKLIAGRNFSADHSKDGDESYIINEKAAQELGWNPAEAVGKHFSHDGKEVVIGVVEDFHMQSIHHEIKPLMIRLSADYIHHLTLKVNPENLPETIKCIESSIKEYSSFPFDYSFMNEQFNQLYKADLQLARVLWLFTLISFLIASIGLFGLAAFSVKTRIKEIGIRKVLGAGIKEIILSVSTRFLVLIAIGFVLSIPISWFFMSKWLQNFAYRIPLEPYVFILPGSLILTIGFLTVFSQSIKAALTNPINTLKHD